MRVSFQDCQEELLNKTGPEGLGRYRHWRKNRGNEVVEYVENFTHEHLFKLTSSDLKKMLAQTEHALGDIKKEEQLDFIENFTCPFAFQHIFHGYIEQHKAIPTWQEIERYLHTEAKDKWINPLREYLRTNPQAIALIRGDKKDEAGECIKRATRWRLGKLFLSNIRELDLLIRLHEAGKPVRYHLLADVLLRVDFWLQNTLICLYFANPKYRDHVQGRKPHAQNLFDGGEHDFKIVESRIERQGHGRVWFAKEHEIKAITDVLP